MASAKPSPRFPAHPRKRSRLRGGLLSLALLGLACAPACNNSGGGSGSAAQAPQVQSLDVPGRYPGQVVTLQGTGFTGATQVNFGTAQALTFTVVSDTTITATVPPNALPGSAPVTVVTPAGTSPNPPAFTVLALPALPAVTQFTPQAGAPGTRVTLAGTGFSTATGVSFGGVQADPSTLQVQDDTALSILVPAGAAGGPCLVTVTNPAGPGSSNGDFTVTLPPTLSAVTPDTVTPGQSLTLTGSGFTGATQVLFATANPGTGAAAPVPSGTDTQIAVQVPATAVTGPVTVETNHGAVSSAPAVVTVIPVALTAAGFNPGQGPEGTLVTITGSGLGQVAGVTFGGVAAVSAPAPAPDGSSLAVVVPPGAATGPVALQIAGSSIPVPGGAFTVQSPALALSGFSSATAGGVLTVTLAGANLNLATGVSFAGPATSTAITVSPDSATLTVPVPAGAVTGPMTLLTAGGPLPVPGGDLTVPPPAAAGPVITGINPPQGVPGTEVTVAGSGFTGATGITYAGQSLDPARYDVDSDTRIRVRVPDDAQASGTIGVTTSASGTPAMSPGFILSPSRRAVLPQPLVAQPGLFGEETWLNYPTRRRAAMYDIGLPQAPVFHAYNPGGVNLPEEPPTDGNRPGHFATRFSLNLQLPTAPFFEVLPASIRTQLANLNLDADHVDIFVASQDYQYDGATGNYGVYLFRPHYWTDPDAPYTGVFYTLHNLQGGIFEADPGVTISGNNQGVLFNFGISTHGPGVNVEGAVIASGNTEPMGGFDLNRSTGLWSLVRELPPLPPAPDNTGPRPQVGRAAVTLHLLFNDADQVVLNALTPTVHTVQELAGALSRNLSASHGVQMLLELGRPVVNTVTPGPVDGAGNQVLTLTGTCLTGSAAVLLNGAAVPAAILNPVSDAIVKVTVPAAAAAGATLSVQSAFGSSDPVPVPAS